MKKLLALSVALALGGCASMPALQKVVHRPQAHVVPAPSPAPIPAPVVVAPQPGSPITQTKLGKPRWYDEARSGAGWVRHHLPHLHHKAADAVQKGN
jgi:hypothetical protein